MLMPPRSRYMPNAYPAIANLTRLQMSNVAPMMRYIALCLFISRPDLVACLPFQDKADIWDFEYAINKRNDLNRIAAKQFLYEWKYIEIQEVTGYDDNGPVIAPVYIRAMVPTAGMYSSSTSSDPSDDDYDDSDFAEYQITYSRIRNVTYTDRYRLTVKVNNAMQLNQRDLTDVIIDKIESGDVSFYRSQVRETSSEFEDGTIEHEYTNMYTINGNEFDDDVDIPVEPFYARIMESIEENNTETSNF
jgi:hypothetical protein